MSELNSLQTEQTNEEVMVAPPKRNPFARLGCGLLVVLWFMFLLTPCALFYLATNGEIRISHVDIPESYEHPQFLIELISEVDYRGIRVVNSSVVDTNPDGTALCVQTDVRYFLWETIDDNPDTSYCDCYTREISESTWTLTGTTTEACTTNP